MRSYDLSPLFRSTVGFDRLSRLLETATTGDEAASYPPYNIEKLSEDSYRITMAVAGFGLDDLNIVAHQNSLTVTGKAKKDEPTGQFLYRGIAGRAFERRFQLADFIKVTSASLQNGLLHIELAREVPEAMKPRSIPIVTAAGNQSVEVETPAPAPALTQQAA
ncbi:Hsp20 family protein [Azospirillum melinis]|uniref:Hsp20 family protein n=1 Tax=Azospirillum melinis TaxID=328839 RepID=A0ABX2KFZ2_9PROT|nr:Hsp20 family protein [Azospirillum melinis]MBP2305072.1 molecular chaperone IbpA [Azospirillum melinis]NUB02525.1 Hsp20 family protein [Azospirillum melinis]